MNTKNAPRNPFVSLVRTVIEWLRPTRRIGQSHDRKGVDKMFFPNPSRDPSTALPAALSHEQLRQMLGELLAADPEFARRFFMPLAGTVFPIVLENCDNNSFYRAMVDGGTNGFGVIVVNPHVAQSNYFYHLQSGKGLRVKEYWINHPDSCRYCFPRRPFWRIRLKCSHFWVWAVFDELARSLHSRLRISGISILAGGSRSAAGGEWSYFD